LNLWLQNAISLKQFKLIKGITNEKLGIENKVFF